jgi:hypothetical protein
MDRDRAVGRSRRQQGAGLDASTAAYWLGPQIADKVQQPPHIDNRNRLSGARSPPPVQRPEFDRPEFDACAYNHFLKWRASGAPSELQLRRQVGPASVESKAKANAVSQILLSRASCLRSSPVCRIL